MSEDFEDTKINRDRQKPTKSLTSSGEPAQPLCQFTKVPQTWGELESSHPSSEVRGPELVN
ncbi:hypothetical protein AVDCRST_MAG81-3340 [uncultured Synechococcales cyanobacterium]|uniref:Uncharacterized protein n=1 Tax=uncultured Synechococcales cyanobacterium TaxID=1936017 RepID=A0A6J4VML8_9CYAN|nr:hypothetical protein AVDCRST_MAG81-3340 [uncultured Synechococcales cyanobacterium]